MKVINYIIRRLSIILLSVLSAIVYPHRVYGRKNIPKNIPYLIYGNHISMIDPVFIITAFSSRNTFYMGKEELFKNPILSWYFRVMGGFPVKRGTADMAAIRQCVNHIKDGDIMVIFPEGTRNTGDHTKLQEFHNGASLVLHNSKVSAIPVYLENKKKMRIFSFTKVHIGELIDMSEYTEGKLTSEKLSASTERLKVELEKLVQMQ
ncbi:MAG: 1-acyl-sn-glycerol-3-phosphate acyltransferase [Clostridia bacterium]|nr:1-acyl-sn-glycerol-3-phosphate acyltransferase [Clostridia bacterium]